VLIKWSFEGNSRLRIPELDGALNFRDMGGYPGANGRAVKWRTLFRSGTTYAMTARDLEQLDHVRFAYDLRSNRERLAQPNVLMRIPNLTYNYRADEQVEGDIQRLFASDRPKPEHSHALMLNLYRELPYDFEESFRELFKMIARGNLPLVFNCAAGKDRTGVAAALVLAALGVSREVILADYLLTAQFFERSCSLLLNGHYREMFGKVDREVWEPLMRVHPEYLSARFDRLIERHGSVENYLRERLEVDQLLTERLQIQLLE